MTPPPTIDELDDDLLEDWFDPGSLARGRAYADAGRATLLQSPAGTVRAVCLGSGRSTYVVSVRWRSWRDIVDLQTSCTCPLGGDCKHCVAAILAARRQQARGAGGRSGSTAGWRRALAGLASADVDEGSTIRVALQVVVEHPRPNRYATGTPTGTGPRITIRPMRPGKTGKWIKTGATWRDICSPYIRNSDVDPVQRSALRALHATARVDPYFADTSALSFAELEPSVWHQLAHARDVGIELIGERPTDVVELSPTSARASIDLTADETGDVTLSAGLAIGDELVVIDGEHAGLLGGPPHGSWVLDGTRLRLVPLAAPLPQAIVGLMADGALAVPARDVDELLDVYQPALARHATVRSSDGSVTITTTRFDRLALVVGRPALDEVSLHWFARYRRGERTVDHPVRSTSREGRDRAAEAAATGALQLPTHLVPELAGADGAPQDLFATGADAVAVLSDVIPWLEANTDVEIEMTGAQPDLREAREDPLISLTVRDGDPARDGNDWFDLGVEVSVDGETIDFATLFTALDRDDDLLILPSGTWLRLDRPELTRLRELIAEAQGLAEPSGAGTARVNRFQTSWWDELRGLGVVAEQSERWSDAVARMAALSAPEPVTPPARLDAVLRPYQQEGLDWLCFLHANGLGGILADDMGLGKTVQTLALCLHILERDPDARFLVVAPTSVVENWAREAAHFAPGVAVRTVKETGARRGTPLAEEVAGASIVVTSYALFRIEFEDYARHDWDLLLLDEAQFVKNHTGKTYQCARRLDATTKIAITGTPLENSLMDLWSLLSITAPGLFPDPKRFSDTYRKPIEAGRAPELLTTLRRRIAPLMRRRTKDAVLTELPPKIEQTIEVELGARHARIYQTQLQRQRQKVLGLVGDVQKHRFEILRSLTILRQLALDPGLIDPAHDKVGSAKLDRLLDDLGQVVAEGHRALVFSQFTRYLARVRVRLDAAGIAHSYLDGKTRDRDAEITRFKDGDVPVFVISLKAGGFGLNLTEASYCFVLDPWWNPATETQAVDRTHRIGQERSVMVYRYVSTDTIEEKVMDLKARKAALFTSVMDAEGALAGALTEDDIRSMLDLPG
jgi:superfamily II DNA or RNA helicase